jgi:hypothetical protein
MSEISQSQLKEVLDYNRETGVFTWAVNVGSRAKKGRVTGCVNDRGYVLIQYKGKVYGAHRLAWLYVHGELPKHEIDHINHNKEDNSIANLRDVPHAENQRNKPRHSDNSSGYTGVQWNKVIRKWVATVCSEGKSIHLGCFDIKEDAVAARSSANVKYGFHQNHGQ